MGMRDGRVEGRARVVLTGATALECYRTMALTGQQVLKKTNLRSLENTSCPNRAVREACLRIPWLATLGRPWDVLVGSRWARRVGPSVRRHAVSERLPARSLCRVEGPVFVVRPELLFVTMACSLPLPLLVLLGLELCGHYAVVPCAERGYVERPPLTSVAELRAYLDRVGVMRGVGPAKWAVDHLVDHARSPREAVLFELLRLPMMRGGYGFASLVMDREVSCCDEASAAAEPRAYRCDLFLPEARLDIEYDDGGRLPPFAGPARDDERRACLEASGFSVLSITDGQLASVEAVDEAAQLMARESGRRLRIRTRGFESARDQLRGCLLATRAASLGVGPWRMPCHEVSDDR